MTTTDQAVTDADPQLWALAVACSNEGVWDWDLRSNRVFYSERWKSMLGCSLAEVGDSLAEWRSRVHPDDLDRAMQEIQDHLDGQTEFFRCEHRMRHKDGHEVWILARGQARRDAQGRAIRMTGFHTDVTVRRQAQEVAENLSQELSAILDLSPDGFVAFDASERVKYVTAAFEAMTGLKAAQLLGLDEDRFWALLQQRCQARSRASCLAEVRHNLSLPNNQRRNLLELTQPAGRVLQVNRRDSGSSRIQRILCFRDVSFETEVDRHKSEFMSTAAHELRTPLASIYGFAETLLTQEVDAATRREFTEIIYQQSQAMSKLLNEMLDLARIEARRQTDFVYTELSARQLLQQVLEGFKPPSGRAAAVLHAPAELLLRVDVKKACQVLLNVLSNAYKYSPAGGAVQIEVASVTPAGASPEVVIHVIDQGIGMSPEQLSRLFERFYRANPSSRIPGTGLGMSIVKEIMTLLEGRVELSSSPGKGTRVSLIFPAATGC